MISLHPSAPETASGVGAAVDLGPTMRFLSLSVTLASLTGSITFVVESAPDLTGPWRQCGEPTSELFSSTIAYDRWVRLRWAGTPAGATPFESTFTATAQVQRVYAHLEHLTRVGLPEAALRGVSTTDRAKALLTASNTADTKLAQRWDLPIVAWQDDLSECVAKIGGYEALSNIGFNPEDGADSNVLTRHDAAQRLLREVVDGRATFVGIVDSSPDVDDDGIAVVTSAPRRWKR